jgi:sulfhydrogenase subunit beta (sulfur reductase)
MQQAIPAEKLTVAVKTLASKYRVIAPTRKGASFVFAAVKDGDSVVLDYPTTILPLKKVFLPPNDALMRFNRKTQTAEAPAIDSTPTVFFGVHNYDLQGLFRLDHAFRTGVPEETYLTRRENAIFVGVGYQPDEYHFSNSVGIPMSSREGFDAFLTRFDDVWRIEALTAKGKGLLKDLGELLVPCDRTGYPVVHFKNRLKQSVAGIREIFHGAYNHPVWQETARRCYSCGTCTVVCPTCYCFDVDDETTLGTDEGSRLRRWDSCQFLSFTTVAGGEAFREKRNDRVRHRMSRKFSYITDDRGQPFCVGCGRCVRQCTASISIVDVMNALL